MLVVFGVGTIGYLWLCFCYGAAVADNSCAVRQITGRSIVCVCNDTYCDDIVREQPAKDQYISYTSSEGGSRFKKVKGQLEAFLSTNHKRTLTLHPDKKHQTIKGFGGAVTDAAGINWKNLSETLQRSLVSSYYGENGIEYNMIRVPIGGCDFSTHPYAYNEVPVNDVNLRNYSLTQEDYLYKLPLIKEIIAASKNSVNILASTWSPPVWMKSNNNITGFSHLKEEYYQTYADYHLKFIEKYAAEGVKIWGITTTNEPLFGVIPIIGINTLGWTAEPLGKWIVNNLGPTIHNSTFKDVKILTGDDQRYVLPILVEPMLKKYPKVLDYIDGVAIHAYFDMFIPPSIFNNIKKKYSGLYLMCTEASQGTMSKSLSKVKVELGSWVRAKIYVNNIMENLNNDFVGWIEWNLCLNSKGGPNWANYSVDSPIIVFPENGKFVKQPMFYAIGHFSKFIPRGSVRIEVNEKKDLLSRSVDNVAFLTPRGTVVVVMYNDGDEEIAVTIKLGEKQATISLENNSVTTVELSTL